MPSVSHSEAESFLRCRRHHYYSYDLGLQRIDISKSLAMGSAGHAILEAFYKRILEAGTTKTAQRKAFGEATMAAFAKYEEIMRTFNQDETRMPLGQLFKFYIDNEPYVKKGYVVMAVEKEFNVQYDETSDGEPITMPFVIDLILTDPNQKVLVVDHKFVWDFYDYGDADLQPQIPKYIGGMRALKYPVDYGEYNMLRTRLIRGEKMSKAELVEAIETAIRKAGGDPNSDYEKPVAKHTIAELEPIATDFGISQYAGPKVEQILEQLTLDIPVGRVQRSFMDQVGIATQIRELNALSLEERDDRAYRTANKLVCNSCPFRELCSMELSGGNTKLLLQTDFKSKDKRAKIEISEDAE